MFQNLLCLLRLDVGRKVLLLVFALNWGGLLLGRLPGYIEDGESVYKVHMATPDEMKQLKLGGGPRTLDVDMTVMCSVLSKMKRC